MWQGLLRQSHPLFADELLQPLHGLSLVLLLGLSFLLLFLRVVLGLLFRGAGFFLLFVWLILTGVSRNRNSQNQKCCDGADGSNCSQFGTSGDTYTFACACQRSGALMSSNRWPRLRESPPSTQQFIATIAKSRRGRARENEIARTCSGASALRQ